MRCAKKQTLSRTYPLVVIQHSEIVKDAEGKPASGLLELTVSLHQF
jgi:hypothetical protein